MKKRIEVTFQATEPKFDPLRPHDLESLGSILQRMFKAGQFGPAPEKVENRAA